jgi:alpha-N-arabinofuranosidase
MPYRNPVIPGFHPDPSICRVGRDYYLVTSSFEYFPGLPIFHSRDLVNWRRLGFCLDRPSQLDLEGTRPPFGIWAPTLRHHAGRFYVAGTNTGKKGNFLISAENPAGPWTEPLWIDPKSWDPSLLFDDDGQVYYHRAAPGNVLGARIDVETGRLQDELRPLDRGRCSPDMEGPHLYRIDGRYYLLAAEGGTRFGHMATIARSDSPWGPFEHCPRNPILTHRHLTGNTICCAGHGDLVQAHDGSWWIVFLACRRAHWDALNVIGRETFLAPVAWVDGWPVVNDGRPIELEMPAPTLPLHAWPAEPERDDFDAPALGLQYQHLRNPRAGSWSLEARRGWLRMAGNAAALDDADAPAFVARAAESLTFRAAVRLSFEPSALTQEAGLSAYLDPRHHYEVLVTRRDGQRVVLARRRIGDVRIETPALPLPAGPVVLEIRGDGERLSLGWSAAPDGPVQTLVSAENKYLSIELANVYTGLVLAMYATGCGQVSTAPADFDWFDYRNG